MKKKLVALFSLLVLFALAPLLASAPAKAGSAGLLLSPIRIVLENGTRYATLMVRNDGDATGRYKIEIVDATMDENGGIRIRDDGNKDEFSAIDMLSYSPRNITLKPDESQAVRILVKNIPDLADGEYRSHIQVRMTESDLDPVTSKPTLGGTGIQIQAKITTVIPVIIRRGQTSFTVTVDDARLVTGGGDEKQSPEMKVSLGFSGNRSVLGDIKVTHVAPDGKETQLAFFRGVPIYRGVPKRNQAVPLTVPDGVNIHSGKLRVDFLSQENEGSHVLAEKEVAP